MRRFALVALACALAMTAWPLAKKKKEDETQTLQLPKDLPGAVVGETRRLAFYTTPLSGRGLLSQQVRDALKALVRLSGGTPVVRLRAFVAGTGDLRRVRDIVSETYTERKQPLPSLSLVQTGGLPLEGAQVVLEATVAAKRDVNPYGLAFISAQPATAPNPLDPVAPLTEKSLSALRAAVKAAGSEPGDVLRVTCFFSSLENLAASRKPVEAEYGTAALNFVQTQRAPAQAVAACEAVARLRQDIGAPLKLLSPEGLPSEPGHSQIALLAAPRAVFTGTQVSFGFAESDARLAFGRLKKVIEQAGGTAVAFAGYYPLSESIAGQVRKVRTEFFDTAHPPAGTMLSFESLPSMDAGFAIDAIAVKE
jgi:enamine deaminase RidA (YjgF/YER057c/UK114 family)